MSYFSYCKKEWKILAKFLFLRVVTINHHELARLTEKSPNHEKISLKNDLGIFFVIIYYGNYG